MPFLGGPGPLKNFMRHEMTEDEAVEMAAVARVFVGGQEAQHTT